MTQIEGTPVAGIANTPVTLEEAKLHCRVDAVDEDAWFNSAIVAATRYVENRTRRKYITQTVIERFDSWPPLFRPVYSPLVAVTSLQYIDLSGVLQTLSSSYYTLDTTTHPGRIYESYSQTWPSLRGDRNGVTLTYTAGYGADSADSPDEAKIAIKMLVAHWHENREAVSDDAKTAVPLAIESLISHLAIVEVY